MPLKGIFIVRHAESDEDINPNLNGEVVDSEISITTIGQKQASEMKSQLKKILSVFKGLRVIVSTSNRAIETARILTEGFVDEGNKYYSFENSIRNLNWGDVDQTNVRQIEKERYEAGVLFYSFPGGDHTPEYVKNIQSFTDRCLKEGLQFNHPEALLIVAHGFSMRVIVKCFLGMSDDEFKWLGNPHNCFIVNLVVDGEQINLRTKMPIYKAN